MRCDNDGLQCLAALRHRRGAVSGEILRDLDGFLHRGQQPITTFTPKSGAKTFWSANQKPHHNVGILLHTFTWPQKSRGVKDILHSWLKITDLTGNLWTEAVWIFTVAEDSKAQEVEVSFTLHRVPANVRVSFTHQHHTALQPAAGQVLHHLQRPHIIDIISSKKLKKKYAQQNVWQVICGKHSLNKILKSIKPLSS